MIEGLRQAKLTAGELQEHKDRLNEAVSEYTSVGALVADPKFLFQMAQLVRQIAVDQFDLTDPTPLFVNRASAELGETLELEETVNTMKAVRRHPGSHPLAFTPTKRKFPITTVQYDLPFAIDLEKIIRGQLDASVFADHAAEALSRVFVETTVAAIDAAATGNDYYGRAQSSSVATNIDLSTLDAAIRTLGDVNSDLFIAGRYHTLFPMLGFAGYADVALEELRATGMVGTYKGAKVIILRDDFNFFYGTASIPADKIYLGGGRKGAWLHERDVSALEYQSLDTERAWLKTGFRLDFDVTVLQPYRYHVITIT